MREEHEGKIEKECVESRDDKNERDKDQKTRKERKEIDRSLTNSEKIERWSLKRTKRRYEGNWEKGEVQKT